MSVYIQRWRCRCCRLEWVGNSTGAVGYRTVGGTPVVVLRYENLAVAAKFHPVAGRYDWITDPIIRALDRVIRNLTSRTPS